MHKFSVFTAAFALILLALTGSSQAATTGKINGTVRDAQTGEPLAGANIILEGTSLGAAADLDGDYYIINVPPGAYTLKVTMIGYKTTTQTSVNVSVDRTFTADFS